MTRQISRAIPILSASKQFKKRRWLWIQGNGLLTQMLKLTCSTVWNHLCDQKLVVEFLPMLWGGWWPEKHWSCCLAIGYSCKQVSIQEMWRDATSRPNGHGYAAEDFISFVPVLKGCQSRACYGLPLIVKKHQILEIMPCMMIIKFKSPIITNHLPIINSEMHMWYYKKL